MMDVIIFLATIALITYMVLWICKKAGLSDKVTNILGWISVISLFVGGYFLEEAAEKKYGETIGSYFEKGEFDSFVYYYINAFPDSDTSKNYRVKASITKDDGEYNIYSIYWNNGGETYFEEHGYNTPLIVGEKIKITDDDNKNWWIELTSEKAD